MVTMRDVADRAGVSIATVSFVVNGTKPVSADTRTRIERAMADLGFRRNAVARALASRRTHILAMAYPALDHELSSSSLEFFTSAAATAALIGPLRERLAGRRVGAILCGSTIDLATFHTHIAATGAAL
jgi:DNA-binding LacI/PurR family transcriptional regulator